MLKFFFIIQIKFIILIVSVDLLQQGGGPGQRDYGVVGELGERTAREKEGWEKMFKDEVREDVEEEEEEEENWDKEIEEREKILVAKDSSRREIFVETALI